MYHSFIFYVYCICKLKSLNTLVKKVSLHMVTGLIKLILSLQIGTPFLHWLVRFNMVPFKALSDIKCMEKLIIFKSNCFNTFQSRKTKISFTFLSNKGLEHTLINFKMKVHFKYQRHSF